jgi:hypothetical protein
MLREGFEHVIPVDNSTNRKLHGKSNHGDGQNKP